MRGITEERLKEVFSWFYWPSDNEKKFFEALLSECAELNAWQPIETAPLGKKLWLFMNSSLGIGRTEGKLYTDSDRQYFTHWQELPEDPK